MYGPGRSWCILQPGTGESTIAIRPHGSARTTPRIRAELQLATGSHRALAKLYGLTPTTVAKWRARTSVLDEPMGPRDRASQHPSQEQEHLAIALRKQGHLSLDDLMGQSLETAPKLSHSALHRCLQRHGISRQPATYLPRRHGKPRRRARAKSTAPTGTSATRSARHWS
jgi:transposase